MTGAHAALVIWERCQWQPASRHLRRRRSHKRLQGSARPGHQRAPRLPVFLGAPLPVLPPTFSFHSFLFRWLLFLLFVFVTCLSHHALMDIVTVRSDHVFPRRIFLLHPACNA